MIHTHLTILDRALTISPSNLGVTSHSHRVEAGDARKTNHVIWVMWYQSNWRLSSHRQSIIRRKWNPNKNSEHWCTYQYHTLIPASNVSWLHRERKIEASHLEPSKTLPYASLPLTNFNIYPVPVIQHNHDQHSFQWDLWVLVANY